MEISFQRAAELISLALSFPTIILAITVVVVWIPSVKFYSKSSHDWFISGVVAGFTGAILDNLFWLLPWSLSFIGSDQASPVFMAGVYFNIFFRQGLGIFAAYCHLRAADEHNSKPINYLNKLLITSHIIGVIYTLVLIFYAI